MKKILFVTLFLLVLVLASCTLTPFAYLFGGGMVTGGGHSSSNSEVELKLLFSYEDEDFYDVISRYIVEIKGDANIYDNEVPKETLEKNYKLKSGQYSIRIRALNAEGKMLGVFNTNIILDASKEKKAEITVDLNRTVTLTISFDNSVFPTTQQMNSRFIDNRANKIRLFVRQGIPEGQGPIVITDFANISNGATATFNVDLETNKEYTFEAYTQVTNQKPGNQLQTQLAIATQTLGYGATHVSIGAVQNYNVVIDVNNFFATATQDDIATGSVAQPKVEIMFPEKYLEYRMPTCYVAPGTINIPESEWGNVNLFYIKADNTSDQATSVNLYDANKTVKFYGVSNNAIFQHDDIDPTAAGEYYYWFNATDTNNIWFHFPMTAISGNPVSNEPVGFTLYEDSSGDVVVQ